MLAETVDAFALRSMASIAISSEEKPARGGVVVVGVRCHALFSLSITFSSGTRVNVEPPIGAEGRIEITADQVVRPSE